MSSSKHTTLGSDPAWMAPQSLRLPDFIIAGAMKCGTTSLHDILNAHPQVFIPLRELHFYSMDAISNLAYYSYKKPDEQWFWPDLNKDPDRYWKWYSQNFAEAPASSLIGEDTTTYIQSPQAAARIAQQQKETKLIFCLRQPSLRAYSHYLHMLRAGRAMFTFDKMITCQWADVLPMSDYLQMLLPYLELIPRERMHFVIFEEFLKNKREVIEECCQFIGLDSSKIPDHAFETYSNEGFSPRSEKIQALHNRMMRAHLTSRYQGFFEGDRAQPHIPAKTPLTFWDSIVRKMNQGRRKSRISKKSKAFLDDYFQNRLQGLNEVVGRDVLSLWFD